MEALRWQTHRRDVQMASRVRPSCLIPAVIDAAGSLVGFVAANARESSGEVVQVSTPKHRLGRQMDS